MFNFALFFSNYLLDLPVILVWIAGGIIALSRRRQHPRRSLFLVLALSIFLLRAFLAPIVMGVVADSEATPGVVGMVQNLFSAGFVLLAAGGWVLLLAAALGRPDEKMRAESVPGG